MAKEWLEHLAKGKGPGLRPEWTGPWPMDVSQFPAWGTENEKKASLLLARGNCGPFPDRRVNPA